MSTVPDHLYYSDQHEWVLMEEDTGTIGITDYAQSELGDIVFVELPEVGDILSQGEPFGTIEAVKTVAELFAPVSGEVVEINTSLENTVEKVNSDPYTEGWMIKIRIQDPGEMDLLLAPEAYDLMIRDL